jgi:hypothetical protein
MPLGKDLSAADLPHLTRRFDERYAQARKPGGCPAGSRLAP